MFNNRNSANRGRTTTRGTWRGSRPSSTSLTRDKDNKALEILHQELAAEKEKSAPTNKDLEERIVHETFASGSRTAASPGHISKDRRNSNNKRDRNSDNETNQSKKQNNKRGKNQKSETKNAEDMQDDDAQMHDANNKPPEEIKVLRQTIFKMATLAENIKGNSEDAKKRTIENRFLKFGSYKSVQFKRHEGKKYILIGFSHEDTRNEITKKEFTYWDDPNKETYKFQKWNEIKGIEEVPQNISLDTDDVNKRTIIVTQIPLNIKKPNIYTIFEQYGKIIEINLITRGRFQKAFIQYEKQEDIQIFTEKIWGFFIKDDPIRIFPKGLNGTNWDKRNAHCTKLAGLPSYFKTKDIENYLEEIEAKAIFRPRRLCTNLFRE
jgi:hypothetical protein